MLTHMTTVLLLVPLLKTKLLMFMLCIGFYKGFSRPCHLQGKGCKTGQACADKLGVFLSLTLCKRPTEKSMDCPPFSDISHSLMLVCLILKIKIANISSQWESLLRPYQHDLMVR